MNIILLDNQFEGAYGSIGVFIKEVFEELMLMGHRVFVAKTVEVAISIYEKNDVDFSIGIGKYGFVVDGKALYDRYNTMHYQWIIDNPYKIKIDYESSNITYVVIDGLFASCIEGVKNFVLELPLGVSSNICRENVKTRTEGIVFAGQIKNPNLIYHEISEHRLKRQITDVIEQQLNQLDEPYINLLNDKVKDIEMEDKKMCLG